MMSRKFILFVCLVLLLASPAFAVVNTDPVSGETSYGATLNGELVSGSTDVWFDYGTTAASLALRTETQTVAVGTFSYNITGLITGQEYFYCAANANGTGAVESFNVTAVTPVPTPTYSEEYFNPLKAAKFNITEMSNVGMSAFTDILGVPLTYSILFFAIIGILWMRQEDVRIAAVVAIFAIGTVGLQLTSTLPKSVEMITYIGVVVVIGVIAYSLWKRR